MSLFKPPQVHPVDGIFLGNVHRDKVRVTGRLAQACVHARQVDGGVESRVRFVDKTIMGAN